MKPTITSITYKCKGCNKEFTISKYNFTRKHSKLCLKCSGRRVGKSNFKGERAGERAKHLWISTHIARPKACQICKKNKVLEISNIGHQYNRENLDEWQYICRECHRKFDVEYRKKAKATCFKCGNSVLCKQENKQYKCMSCGGLQ